MARRKRKCQVPHVPLSTTFPASSAIARATYHADRQVLDLWYRGGDRYSYSGVPVAVYEALRTAPSAGEFVNLVIKPAFRYEVEPRRRRFRPRSDNED
jgi:hypothetical protein